MAEIKWFKVLTDMFSDDKIKIIQSMPEGDSLIVMWFKVLAQAGKTNDGGYIYLKKNIPYTPGMLATLFNKPQQSVEFALRTFSEFGMIDMDDRGYIFITNWEKHQNIEGMDKVREQTRLRNARYREKKRLELMDGDVRRDVTMTDDDAIELDKEKDKKSSSSVNPFKLYQNEIGVASPTSTEMLIALVEEHGDVAVCSAIREAVRQSKRKLSYVEGILKRWKTDGRDQKKSEENIMSMAEWQALEKRKKEEAAARMVNDL